MLAPIVTKDMRLFPTQKVPNIRNVRSRAQSLDHFQQLQNSSNTLDRLVPVKPRNSRSTGNISSTGRLSTSRQKVAPPRTNNNLSPPKNSMPRKSTLTAIQEGVEMTESRVPCSIGIMQSCSESSDLHSRTTKKSASNGHSKLCEAKKWENSPEEENGPVIAQSDGKKKRGVLKWITNTFRKTSRDKIPDNASTMSN